MLNFQTKSIIPLIIFFVAQLSNGFTPSKNMELLTEIVDFDLEEKSISETHTHVDILRKGLIRSITKYFNEKQQKSLDSLPYAPKRNVDVEKSDTIYFKNINELYKDYLSPEDYRSIAVCNLEVEKVIDLICQSVAGVDFDPLLKDLPYAHFDANKISESNKYVQVLTDSIHHEILINKNLASARKKIGSVLHTIQDFYSHSNWIEMGNRKIINKDIGTKTLGSIQLLKDEDVACFSEKCTKKVLKCKYLKSFSTIIQHFSLNLPLNCPIVYFKCENNVVTDKLTSGYYTGQKLPNGVDVVKPENSSKCSHGGALDLTATKSAQGGINKDTAYYFLSPRADLHLIAADLAVKHTEYFFDNLRSLIGDENFDELLQLLHPDNTSLFCFFKRIFY